MENRSTDAADLGDTDRNTEGASGGLTEHADAGSSAVGEAIARQMERHAVALLIGTAVGAVAALAVVSSGSRRGGAVRALFTRSEPTLLAIVVQAAVAAFGRTVSRQVVTAAVEKLVTRAMADPAVSHADTVV